MSPVPFHRLRVAAVVAETADSCSLVFELRPDQASRFSYQPGQFLTLRVPDEQGSVARCYSLSSSPHVDEQLRVTVKRVEGGCASNWICENAEPGTVLQEVRRGWRLGDDLLRPAQVAIAQVDGGGESWQ